MKQILAATDFSTRSHRAFRRAALLAHKAGAELVLLHVVDDDQPPEIIALETREANKILAEQIDALVELRGLHCLPMVASGDPFDALLRTAKATSADLIVMGSHRRQLLRDIFIGTTIERVIRKSSTPVLMVNKEVQHPYARVLVAVDMSEPSAHALRCADTLGLMEARVTIVHAFWAMARGKMFVANTPIEQINEYVAKERLRASAELMAFLKEFSDRGWTLYIEEGLPFEVISRAVNEIKPDLLVMGTHGRSGLAKILLGSVTEEVLRSLEVDILAVPPAK
jgi:universal stress protein E